MSRLEELEQKFAENPRRYFAPLANEYRKAGDAQRAAELCKSQLPEIPGHISGHIILGQALYDATDYAGSRAALETALGLDPENIVALRYLGDIARDSGDAAEAEQWYARTLEADPYNEAATSALQSLRESTEPASGTPPVAAKAAAPSDMVAPDTALPVAAVEPDEEVVDPQAAQPEFSNGNDATMLGEFAGDLQISATPESSPSAETDSAALGMSVVRESPGPELVPPDTMPPGPVQPETVQPETTQTDVIAPEVVPEERGSSSVADVADPAEESLRSEERVMEAAAPFVTETMAGLYMEQGYPHEALELLLQLAEQRPHDESLRVKIEGIQLAIVARRDAVVAAARAERDEAIGPRDAPLDPAVAEADSSAFVYAAVDPVPLEAPPPEPQPPRTRSVREMFAQMDRIRPRHTEAVTPRPMSRLRSDFVPMPPAPVDPRDERVGGSPSFAFESTQPEEQQPPPVPRVSGPHPTFDPSAADTKDFDAWLRGLRGP